VNEAIFDGIDHGSQRVCNVALLSLMGRTHVQQNKTATGVRSQFCFILAVMVNSAFHPFGVAKSIAGLSGGG